MAKLIKADGTTTPLEKPPTFEEARKMVGGFITVVDAGENAILLNEDGLLLHLPENLVASVVYGKWVDSSDHFVGDVVILEGEEEKRATLGD
jgi:hypothetical protein